MRVDGAGDRGDITKSTQQLLSAPDAERLVESLQPLGVEQVGGEAWQQQHDAVVELNLTAHHNVATHSDEFVKEALVLHDRLHVLVFDLLTHEVWKQRVAPLLWGHLATSADSVDAYTLLYHEAALTNLLESALFHGDACEALGEEAALELVDWAARRLLWLNSHAGRAPSKSKERSPKDLLDLTLEQQLRRQAEDIEFGGALCSLAILRYLTDRVRELPLSVAARMVAPADIPALLAALLDEPPWERRQRGKGPKGLQRFEGGAWRPVPDRLLLCQHDIQAWLALSNLLLEPVTRGRYDLDGPRTASLMRLRRLLHEAALQQLPPLQEVVRLLDALETGHVAPPESGNDARLIMEQVPMMRQAILDSVHCWPALAHRQRETVFAPGPASAAAHKRRHKLLAAIDYMCSTAEDACENATQLPDKQAAEGPEDTAVHVKVETQLVAGVHGEWATYEFHIDTSAPPEQVLVPGPDGGAAIAGIRHRLASIGMDDDARELPTLGRISITHCGRSVQARLALPAAETRHGVGLAEVIWITAGRLGVEGLALQLKLQKLQRCRERDKTTGTWHAYQIVGGACAIADGGLQSETCGTKGQEDAAHTALNF